MGIFHRFVWYWTETFKVAKTFYGMLLFLIYILVYGAAVAVSVVGNSTDFINPTLHMLSTIAAIGVTLWSVFWFPVKMHEEQEKLNAKEKAGLRLQIENAKRVDDKRLAEIIHREKLNVLGESLVELQNLRHEVLDIDQFRYTEEIGKEKNEAINNAINKVIKLLHDRISSAEAALFRDARSKPLPPQESFHRFDDQKWMRARHVYVLDAYIAELKAITERHLKS